LFISRAGYYRSSDKEFGIQDERKQMITWIILVLFNGLYGWLSGFITSLVFGSRNGTSSSRQNQRKENKKMIVCVTTATFFSGMVWYIISPKEPSSWLLSGILFGVTVTLLTPFLLYCLSQWQDLALRPKPGIIIKNKKEFIQEWWRSIKTMDAIVMSMFTLLYGIFTLLTPILGLGWGYVVFHLII
jgi:hypothetical protein